MSDIVSASSTTFAEINGMQAEIDDIEDRIGLLIRRGNKLATESDWHGKDADRWRADWHDETSPKLTTTLDVLRSIHTNAKDSASSIMRSGGNLDFG